MTRHTRMAHKLSSSARTARKHKRMRRELRWELHDQWGRAQEYKAHQLGLAALWGQGPEARTLRTAYPVRTMFRRRGRDDG